MNRAGPRPPQLALISLSIAGAGLRLCQPLHQFIRSRMHFVDFDLAGLFDEQFRLLFIVRFLATLLDLGLSQFRLIDR
jgi:hypothetical protein